MPVFSNACTRTRKPWSEGVSHLRSLKRRRSGGSVSSRFSGDDLDDIDIPVFDLFFAETLSQPPPPLPTSKTISHWCTRSPYALDFTSYLPLDNVFPSSPLPAKSDSDHSYCPTEVPQTSEISPLSVGGTLDPPHDFGTLFSALLHLDRPSSSSVQQPSLSAHCGQSTVFSATSSFTCDVGLSRWSTETGSDGSEQEEEDGEHSEGMDESFWYRPQQSGLTLINTRDDLVILAHRGFVHTAICTRYPSAMPSHRPSAPPPTVVEFGLPLLTLTNLAVVDLNQPAADALRLAWVEGQTAALETAALLGFKEAEAEDGRRAEEWARGELDRLAEQSRGLRWDEGIAVEFHAARGAEPIEVDVRVVRVAPSEGAADLVYSILLLRPSSSSLSPTPRVKSPTSPSPASSPQNPSTATPSPPSPSPDYIPDEPALQPADHLHRIVNSFSNIVSAQSNPPALGATTSPPVGGRFLPPTQDLVDFVSIAPAILVMLSAEGQLLWLNDSWFAYTGVEPSSLVSDALWLSIHHADDMASALAEFGQGVREKREFSISYRLRRHDGEWRWHTLSAKPHFRNGEVAFFCAVVSDHHAVSTSREIIEKNRREKADLEGRASAARDASTLKSEFLSTITHEIRTPIASVLGIMELLLQDDGLTSAQRDLVEKAAQSGETLLNLIGDVLDLRKVETGELTLDLASFYISDALVDSRSFVVMMERKKIEYIEDVHSFYDGPVIGDRYRLRQILSNALSNAVKFTKEGSITLRIRQLEECYASVTLQFEVIDTGVGLTDEVLKSLFVPFRQADASTARQFGGSGLGLTIARKLVELMNGTVELTSPGLGLGSRFTATVTFEKASVSDESNGPDARGTTTPSGVFSMQTPTTASRRTGRTKNPEGVRILVAEDNVLIREITTKLLRKMKFSVDAVEDGQKCLDEVEKANYDIILMDGQMPNMDGYAATAAIRNHPDPRISKVRIIALTASAISGDRERCIESGMDSYLAKPVRSKELEAGIWEQIDAAEPDTPASPPL